MMPAKLSRAHLERAAYVYVRQSTPTQVLENLESRRRQYGLTDRARTLGFRRVEVVDEDLGRSGSGRVARPGFERLVSAVCLEQVGGVFALEASRLARNNRDWSHLVDLCGLTRTLIVDAEGIYDPRESNDRLLLGLKGTMSEWELGMLRQRSLAAIRQKAEPLSANVRETRSGQRIRVGRRQRNGTCWDCEREWKRMGSPLDRGRPSEARQILRTRR